MTPRQSTGMQRTVIGRQRQKWNDMKSVVGRDNLDTDMSSQNATKLVRRMTSKSVI